MRYLKYAIGEIVLVVLGILIALQINDWNEQRLDRAQEREYLASMLSDLEQDRRSIDQAVTGNQVLLGRLDELLVLLRRPPQQLLEDPALQRDLYLHALAYTYWYLRVDFSELTMAQLKSSGGLQLITDREVREAMLTYQQGLEACKFQYLEMTHYFHVVEASQKQLFDLRLGHAAYAFIEEDFLHMLEPPKRFESLIEAGEYLFTRDLALLIRYSGDVAFYKTAMNNTNLFLEIQRNLGDDLAGLIHERYGLRPKQ